MKKVTRLARRFVAGTTAEEALPEIKALNERGIHVTTTMLGEDVTDRDEAVRAADGFIHLLERIHDHGLDSNVSLKLTQMGLDIDETFCFDNAMRIVAKAGELGNFVRIDMEGPKHTQLILDMFRRLHTGHEESVGVVVQAMLFRTEQDVAELLKNGVRLRLCKGAYKFPASIAHLKKKDIARAFTRLADTLLDSGLYHGFATHDEKLVQWIIDRVKTRGIDPARFEFQMLYGMRRNRQVALAEAGYHIRCYVPFGTHWFPYFSRRLRERKENVFFVLKNLFTND
jgi:proline dehydrogenase